MAILVWRQFPRVNDYELFNKPCVDWILSNLKQDDTRDLEWPMVFATTLWWLWKWRNCRIFDEDAEIPVDQLGFILAQVHTIKNAMERKGNNVGR